MAALMPCCMARYRLVGVLPQRLTPTRITSAASRLRADRPSSCARLKLMASMRLSYSGLRAAWERDGLAVTDLRVTVYGMKEFELRDPDGHWLWFGQATDEAPTVRE